MFLVLPSDHCPAGNHFKSHRILVVERKNFVRCWHVWYVCTALIIMLEYLLEIHYAFLIS